MSDRSATVGSEAELGGMSNTQEEEEQLDDVRCASFNQDFTSLCVGTVNGYQIYDLAKSDELHLQCHNRSKGQSAVSNCLIVQRLYSSSLVAVVSEDHPRKLCVNHFKKNSHICSYTYLTSILNVLLNRERLIVVCEDKLSIHVVKDMELIHTIADTPSNPSGLCALANSPSNCYLAYPASTSEGVVQIFDAIALKSVVQIAAHDSPLQCMVFSDNGTKLATASQKGTVIRVFAVCGDQAGAKIYELRRGSRAVTISCLSFSLDEHFLLASSNSPTVHLFRLVAPPQPQVEEEASYASTVYSMLNSAVSASAAYLPAQVAGLMVQERCFAWCTLPADGRLTRAALTCINKVPRVVVATADGMVYVFDFRPEEGGECALVKQHNLNPRQLTEEELKERSAAPPSDDPAARLAHLSLRPNSSKSFSSKKTHHASSSSGLALDDPDQFPPV